MAGDAETLRQLDELLFEPSRWKALDASNVLVPGVAPGTLDQALDLVGQGRVTTLFGVVRPEVVAVDIDADGRMAELGIIAAESLADWCRRRALWHLVRGGGGGRGRHHVYTVPGVHADDLRAFVRDLRVELHLPGAKLDPRQQLRPLSAPHRRTGPTPPPQDAQQALTSLRQVLDAPSSRRSSRRRRRAAGRGRSRGGVGPAVPAPRKRRELREPWAAYLAGGRSAALRAGLTGAGADGADRSTLELRATRAMVSAGWSEPQAWAALERAHPTAFTKAAERGRAWWWYVWNAAVAADEAYREEMRDGAGDVAPVQGMPAAPVAESAVADEVEAFRARLAATWRSWPRATRHTDLEVATVLAERAARTGAMAVQVPQRDLVLDTCLRSRTTVRAALARLTERGLVQIGSTYVRGTTDTADTITLRSEQSPDQGRPLLCFDPSRSSHPLPRPTPLATRRALRTPPHSALAGSLPTDGPGLALGDVAHRAGLLHVGQDPATLTAGQRRHVLGMLRDLAEVGLAVVAADGAWSAPTVTPTGTEELRAEGRALQQEVVDAVAAEREAFRDEVDPGRRKARWEAQRRATLAREHKRARVRQTAWWDGLESTERARRRDRYAGEFAEADIDTQARLKQAWARRRHLAGVDERERYQAWLAALPPAELAHRAGERAAAYAALPGPEQARRAAAWAQHRAEWDLPAPRRRRTTRTEVAPITRPEIDLMRRSTDDVEQLVDDLTLFDRPLDLPLARAVS